MIPTMIVISSTSGSVSKVLLGLAAFILSVFTPVAVFYHLLIVFLSMNFLSGLWDDVVKRKQKFSWVKFKVFITRIFLYVAAVSITWLFELYIINEFVGDDSSRYLTTVVSGMFALYEIQSFLCNCANISGNKIFIRISEKIKDIFSRKSKDDDTNELNTTQP